MSTRKVVYVASPRLDLVTVFFGIDREMPFAKSPHLRRAVETEFCIHNAGSEYERLRMQTVQIQGLSGIAVSVLEEIGRLVQLLADEFYEFWESVLPILSKKLSIHRSKGFSEEVIIQRHSTLRCQV